MGLCPNHAPWTVILKLNVASNMRNSVGKFESLATPCPQSPDSSTKVRSSQIINSFAPDFVGGCQRYRAGSPHCQQNWPRKTTPKPGACGESKSSVNHCLLGLTASLAIKIVTSVLLMVDIHLTGLGFRLFLPFASRIGRGALTYQSRCT